MKRVEKKILSPSGIRFTFEFDISFKKYSIMKSGWKKIMECVNPFLYISFIINCELNELVECDA